MTVATQPLAETVSRGRAVQRTAIIGGARIPFARQYTQYAEASNIDMLTVAIDALVQRFGLRGKRLGEIAAGAVLKHSRDANLTREAAMATALAPETPAYDVQMACATSMQSLWQVGNKVALGQIDCGIAGGVDSASDAPVAVNERLRRLILKAARAKDGWSRLRAFAGVRPSMLRPSIPNVNERRTGMSMGEHCELMVKRWKVGRNAQDELALASHQNAVRAYKRGFHDDLMVPFRGLARDNNLREGTSLEQLAKLKPAFDKTSGKGTLTAGNSTPLTDGAAVVLLGSERWAGESGHEPQAWLVDAESAAVEFAGPNAEGLLMAPAYAAPRLLARHGLTLADFDYYEIHEAFSGQVLCTLAAWEDEEYCRARLGLAGAFGRIDRSKLNVNGGSVGLGHPFAATGARIVAGAAKQLAELRRDTGRRGRTLISVCAAGGLGVVAILEG